MEGMNVLRGNGETPCGGVTAMAEKQIGTSGQRLINGETLRRSSRSPHPPISITGQ